MEKYEVTFTQDEQDDIISLYVNNTDILSIMHKYNCDEHNIRKVLKENQIDRQYNTFSDELYHRIVELYTTGSRLFEIEYDLIISEGCITKTLRKFNIEKRSYSDNNRRYYRNQHYFDSIDTGNKAYILGLLGADGCNNGEHNSIILQLQEEDGYIVYRVKEELEYAGPLRINRLSEKNPNHKNQYHLVINDEYMSKRLAELGIVQAKSLIYKFATCVPDDLIHHYVRGYFDGDGCIYNDYKRNKSQVQICGTYEFCSTLKQVLASIGCLCSIMQPKQCAGKNTCVLKINGKTQVKIFCDWIYKDADLRLERKYLKYLCLCDGLATA